MDTYTIGTYLGVGTEYSLILNARTATLTLVVESGPASRVLATRANTVANQRELAQLMITNAINEVADEMAVRS
jgi:hypothetical protein